MSLTLDVHHSILKALIEHNAYVSLGWHSACVPNFEAGIFHLLCLLPLPFHLLNVKNIHMSLNRGIDYLLKLTCKQPYILGTYKHPTRLS
jgi:hypothetical protein